MRPASNSHPGSGLTARRTGPIGLLLLTFVAAAVILGSPARPATPEAPGAHAHAFLAGGQAVVTQLGSRGEHLLGRTSWQGHAFTASTGEAVTVYVSDLQADVESIGQRWADFFASLVHGSELGGVTVYVVSPAEIAGICGDPRAIGCYGSSRLVIVGEPVAGVAPEEVARHEYGHHVAANRANPPWNAIDWGPKRWASYADVCGRVRRQTAFPGDESLRYPLNPGEAFAESYRILNDQKAGATTFGWDIVDPSFYPDANALQAVEQDVLQQWAPPAPQTTRACFLRGGKTIWSLSLQTPLDGELAVTLTLPQGTLHDLALLSADGRTVLARGLWSGAAQKRITYTICGERSLSLRVSRHGAPGPFSIQVSHP